jgi:lipopolysaccharide export system protein LptA
MMAKVSVKTLAFRSLLGGFALGGAALGAISQSGAQAIAAHNSQAPVDFAADRIELQDRQNRVVLSGNVAVTQAGLSLHAARMTIAYTDAGTLQVQRIDATGGVQVARGGESAQGEVAIYDFNRRIITMAGGVALRRGNDSLNGGRLVIDLQSGVSSIDGRAGGSSPALGTAVGGAGSGSGRVSGSFSVPPRN